MRYALRTLWNDRGFALMAVLSLAAGIGVNTAIFSLVNGVLLRPLGFPDPQRLIAISVSTQQFRSGQPLPINLPQLFGWRAGVHSFEGIAAYRAQTMSLSGGGDPELLTGAQVSANLFAVLGVHPSLGRLFQDAEEQFGQHRVALLADSLWRRRFGGDESIVGRTIILGGANYTVVGVLPPDFEFPNQSGDIGGRLGGRMEIFRPLGYQASELAPHVGDLNYTVIARLRPGILMGQARGELTAVEASIDAQVVGGWSFVPDLAPLQQRITGAVSSSLIVLIGAVGAVLLVLCVNLANLLLSRAARRTHEAAIRVALGATRWQLARQSLIETALLAALGGSLGVAAAIGGFKQMLAAAPADLPRLSSVSVDAPVLAFALAISAVTALLFGILPALHSASSASPYEALKSARHAGGGLAGLKLRNLLVALEVGLCAALLVTAGLFLTSFVRLTTIPRGFDVERVLAVDVALPGAKYTKDADISTFLETVLDQVRALPGVESAAATSFAPLQGETWIDLLKAEHDARPDSELPFANLRFVSADYFRTLRMPLRAGRDFDISIDHQPVAIVSESLARCLFPGEEAVGRRLLDGSRLYEIVGVAGDARSTRLDQEPVNMLYVPSWQRPRTSASILVRTAMNPVSVGSAARAAVWSVDRGVPVPQERTLAEMLSESVARRRFQMTLVLLFAVAALALAAFGTYGVVSYAVAQRHVEIGIRMSLGARSGNVIAMVLRQGMAPVVIGLAGGALVAIAIGRYISSLLFRVSPHDPSAFAAASAVLILVSGLACWIPARRAAQVDPLVAMRYE